MQRAAFEISPETEETASASVLFGPQGEMTSDILLGLRQSIRSQGGLAFLAACIADLHNTWSSIIRTCPEMNKLDGRRHLDMLADFLANGQTQASDILPDDNTENLLITPLTVIRQIVEFWNSSNGVVDAKGSAESPLTKPAKQISDVQGFCLGILMAISTSCSHDEHEFERYASTAVRLALAMAAWVDLDSLNRNDSAIAITVRCKSVSNKQTLDRIITRHLPGSNGTEKQAYVSCILNSNTATVTMHSSLLPQVTSDLSRNDMPSLVLACRGRWHCESNTAGVQFLRTLCQHDDTLQLPDGSALSTRVLSNMTGLPIPMDVKLHEHVVEYILGKQSRWDLVFATWLSDNWSTHLIVGEKVPVPKRRDKISKALMHVDVPTPSGVEVPPFVQGDPTAIGDVPGSAIAIIGVSCRFPEADTLEDFWSLIKDAKCVIRQFPEERFNPEMLQRDPKGPYWGGYVRESDMFDHQFFKISGREANAMDPQQRMALAVAYEAVESAGLCGLRADEFDRDIGTYIGVANDDYDCNVASHPVNAFCLTGTLRSMIAGRINHHFGWDGPAVTIDTACSASAVAIHTACRALQSGDCSVALAGGTCTITSSRMTQSLIGAGFLSPTGASKAFDVSADGYCRAEGAGIVVLRRLSDALEHGDHVLGVITGSAVNQASNTSPIFVPDTHSQLALYEKALAQAGAIPSDISYVEAHGTGTQVGDPVEFESIRKTFGAVKRRDPLFVGSVKDNIGHTEAASGVASLVKTLLMLQKDIIPKLANFKTLNPKIAPLGNDRVLIPRENQAWKQDKPRKALINNYGASGSNAALVIQEGNIQRSSTANPWFAYPVYVSGRTAADIRAFCTKLEDYIRSDPNLTLADIAYNLSVKQSRMFDCRLSFVAKDLYELIRQLRLANAANTPILAKSPFTVLCFSGQDGRLAQISRTLYNSSKILRKHLDACELACTQELGIQNVLFPSIFEDDPIEDLATLHCTLFSIQYSCAMSWLDSGLKVDRIIGHSFGQLTALCVAGSLTLRETVYLIVARAHLLDGTSCSIENGTMLSIQGDADDVAILLKSAEKKQGKTFAADVACFNGPRNFVLAGDEASIYTVECIGVKTNQFRMKRLSNSHAYHSRLLDGILPSLRAAAAKLDFKAPSIPIQACTDDDCQDDWSNIITAGQIARHTREPVRFMQTVRRIERAASGRPILWLEAGSSGPVIPMIKNATLDEGKKYHYVSTSLRDDSMAQHNLATATRKLWESNVKVQFWPFHSSESSSYNWLNLPPYQFAKIRHWLEYRPNTEIWNLSDNDQSARTLNEDVFSGYIRRLPGQGADLAYFEINTCHDLYQLALQGHEVVGQSLCPASMYVEFCLAASHILTGAGPDYTAKVSKLSMESPLALYPRGQVLLKLDKASSAELVWDMTIYSSTAGTENQIHATGLVTLTAPVSAMDSSTLAQIFSPMQSLLHARCQEIRTSPASVGYKGSTVYQAFLPHVTYVPYYHGIQSIFSLGKEATAYITLPQARQSGMGDGVCDPVLIDSFTQVSGVLANVFDLAGQNGVEEMWICNYIGDIELNEKFTRHARSENHVWLAYGKYDKPTPKTLTCDIFVLDPQSAIAFIVRSISFQKVSVRSLTKILGKLNIRETALRDGTGNAISSDQGTYGVAKTEAVTKHGIRPSHETLTAQKPERLLPKHNAFNALGAKSINTTTSMSSPSIAPMSKVVEMLQDILEVPAEAIKPSSKLEDLGFDSLIATELLHETRQRFTITISHQELARATQVDDLAQLIGSCGLSTGPDEAIQGRVAARKGRALYGTASPSIIASTTSSVIASGTASSMTSITEPPSPILAQGNTEGSLVNTCSMLRDVLEIPMESIRPNCTLEDLGIDSLLAIELFSEVTKRFSVSLSQAQFADVQTVQELGDLIAAMSKEQATSPPMTAAKQSSLDADKGCTVVYADRNGLKLEADIYYPPARAAASYEPLPIALMIHGGGHVMHSRKDIRPEQTQMLLDAGFLPVSIDYRLCPEVSLVQGALIDVRDALYWARETLPTLAFPGQPNLNVDGDRVVAVGWSSGGLLALSLGWTAASLNIKAPEAVLAYYCPTDYEDPFWREPNKPFQQEPVEFKLSSEYPGYYSFLHDGLFEQPIVAYSPPASARLLGGWMSLQDPRSRIVLYMNWNGAALPILISGLSKETSRGERTMIPMPNRDQIRSISPLAHVQDGTYRTPTYLIHGTADDLVPWQQSKRMMDALQEKGVPVHLQLLESEPHLFDMFRRSRRNGPAAAAIIGGINFLMESTGR